jgi:hypothetical protein
MPNETDTGPEGPETGDPLCAGGAVEADV